MRICLARDVVMSPFDLETPLADLCVASPQTSLPPYGVAILCKAWNDETERPQTWRCTPLAHVAMVPVRVPLRRDNAGRVCDAPGA